MIFKEIMAQLAGQGKTIFYSSHIMDVVEKISSRIILLHDGTIAADGSFDELKQQNKEGSLEEIFNQIISALKGPNVGKKLLDIENYLNDRYQEINFELSSSEDLLNYSSINLESEDIDMLLELADTISSTALCGLGKTAAFPVVSTIKNFRDEYITHIVNKKCPSKTCEKLKVILIEEKLCKGCSKCSRICPVGAISGKIKETFVIDQDKCIKCGACIESCAFKAIKED